MLDTILGLLAGEAHAQIATSTVTGVLSGVGGSIASWLFDVIPTAFLYITPLILVWLFIRFLMRVGRGG